MQHGTKEITEMVSRFAASASPMGMLGKYCCSLERNSLHQWGFSFADGGKHPWQLPTRPSAIRGLACMNMSPPVAGPS